MSLGPVIYWSLWLAMLVIGDPLWEYFGGEVDTDTHFLSVHIPIGIRAGILGWLIYHFMVQHVRG